MKLRTLLEPVHWLPALLLVFLLWACEGRPRFMYPTVSAEDYFAHSPALPAAQACQHDAADALKQALAQHHISPNAVGEQGMSLLILAMSNRSLNAVRALLDAGADPNLMTDFGRDKIKTQPVALAAGGDNTELLKLLLDHGGDPNARFGRRPATFCAADADRYDHLNLLLDRGADLNATERQYGRTLLVMFGDRREYDQVIPLIERGADVSKPDELGGTVAFSVQTDEAELPPSTPTHALLLRVKRLLEARGVHFPVPHPAIAMGVKERVENAQRRRWEAETDEGRRFRPQLDAAERERRDAEARIYAAGGKENAPAEDARATAAYLRADRLRHDGESAFQAWRKTQPGWAPTTNFADGYPEVPTAAEDDSIARADRARLTHAH